jgi:hypothetical protein
VYPPIIARQRLGKNVYTRNDRIIIQFYVPLPIFAFVQKRNLNIMFENISLCSEVTVKLSLGLTEWAPRDDGVWGSRGIASSFLTPGVDGSEWSASRFCWHIPRQIARCTLCVGGWVGAWIGLDVIEKRKNILPIPGIESRLLGRPARGVWAVM